MKFVWLHIYPNKDSNDTKFKHKLSTAGKDGKLSAEVVGLNLDRICQMTEEISPIIFSDVVGPTMKIETHLRIYRKSFSLE